MLQKETHVYVYIPLGAAYTKLCVRFPLFGDICVVTFGLPCQDRCNSCVCGASGRKVGAQQFVNMAFN